MSADNGTLIIHSFTSEASYIINIAHYMTYIRSDVYVTMTIYRPKYTNYSLDMTCMTSQRHQGL